MDTRVIEIDENNIDLVLLEEAGHILRQGGLVAFPTETVYGLGGDALNPESSGKIYAAKGRPSDNPLIVHICQPEALEAIVTEIPEAARKLMEAFWPGPMTLVFNKRELVPLETTGGLNTVAVRLPSNLIARELIAKAGGYVAAPSANLSGKPSPTSSKFVVQDMNGRIDMIIDGKDSCIGLESTIIDVTVTPPMVLRPGYITTEMIEEVLGEVALDPAVFAVASKEPPRAPGMRYRHYAPKGEMTIVSGSREKVHQFICRQLESDVKQGKRTGVLCSNQLVQGIESTSIKTYGDIEDKQSAARIIYKSLREFDDEDIEVIYAEAIDSEGLGQAIMNRLKKASSNNIITL